MDLPTGTAKTKAFLVADPGAGDRVFTTSEGPIPARGIGHEKRVNLCLPLALARRASKGQCYARLRIQLTSLAWP